MGFWQSVLGRSRPKQANLDALFLVPSAAVSLQTALGLRPTGEGAVCFRAASGPAFRDTQAEVVELLRSAPEAPDVTTGQDGYGFTWLQVDRTPDPPAGGPAEAPGVPEDPAAEVDVGGLVTDLHAVNTSLEAAGFGPALLCSLVPFADPSGRRVGLVYLYKQGTFYPFAPAGGQRRDNLTELQVRDALAGELPLEHDLSRWLAIWGAPGL